VDNALRDWLNSSQALIVAVAVVIAGIAALVQASTALRLEKRHHRSPRRQDSFLRRNRLLAASAILILGGLGLFGGRYMARGKLSLNERLTLQAWEALAARKWDDAFRIASECIEQFGAQAEREQQRLTRDNVPLPPVGKVAPDVRDRILERGLLNDVAACYYIKGEAAMSLSRRDDAKRAYAAATRLPHARVYDPAGFFWSPAEAAEARLTRFQ